VCVRACVHVCVRVCVCVCGTCGSSVLAVVTLARRAPAPPRAAARQLPAARAVPNSNVAAAAGAAAAAAAAAGFPDVVVAGICDDPASVLRGDLYCCIETVGPNELFDGHDPEAVAAALAAGATALLANRGVQWPAGLVPDSVPVIYADDVDELAARLAAVLYGELGGGRGLGVCALAGQCCWARACVRARCVCVCGLANSAATAHAAGRRARVRPHAGGRVWQQRQDDRLVAHPRRAGAGRAAHRHGRQHRARTRRAPAVAGRLAVGAVGGGCRRGARVRVAVAPCAVPGALLRGGDHAQRPARAGVGGGCVLRVCASECVCVCVCLGAWLVRHPHHRHHPARAQATRAHTRQHACRCHPPPPHPTEAAGRHARPRRHSSRAGGVHGGGSQRLPGVGAPQHRCVHKL
jgi:hypothetical protein